MSHDAAAIGGQPPSAELVMNQGPWPGQRFPLGRPSITIGRQAGYDVVISDPQVSRRHASLTWDGTRWIVHDLGSANGTFVNGVRLTAPRVLQSGDRVGLGTSVTLGFQTQAAAGPTAQPYPAAAPAYPAAQARGRRSVAVPLAAIALVLLCLAVGAALAYSLLRPTTVSGEGRGPDVLIDSPQHGDQLEVGREVTVHAVARDEDKVVRVELWVDDQLYQVEPSNLPEGVTPFPLAVQWRPDSAGTHTVTARAFDAKGNRGQASINVEATSLADRDGDGLADEEDRCPDEPGRQSASGCPDRDLDGTPDAEDACPDETGLPEQAGCPVPHEGDGDGDAIPDEADACPEEPGPAPAEGCPDADGDGVPDGDDECPTEPGWPASDGCPTPGDSDGDGVADADDACPDAFGRPDLEGCPDDDGDDVADGDDACPDEWGPREHEGCPDRDEDGVPDTEDPRPDEPGGADSGDAPDEGAPDEDAPDAGGPDEGGPDEDVPDTGAGDRDGDGLADDVDACPDDAGLPEHDGCPPPSEDDAGDGTADEGSGSPFDSLEPFDFGDDVLIMFPVEFQALEFEVDQDYDEAYCYASLAGADMERHDFEPSGERRWEIPAELAGRTVAVPEGSELEVGVECGAYHVFLDVPEPEPGTIGEGGGSATHWDLGAFFNSHPETQWTGEVLEGSATGPDGRGFRVAYRLCRDSCEGAAFPPPTIALTDASGQMNVVWDWGGDPEMIDGFRLFINGNYVYAQPKDRSRHNIRWHEPPCGQMKEFQMTAYSGQSWAPDRESPPSNAAVWEGLPCMRTVRVVFDAIETGHLGDDEWWAEGSVGPIYGYFEATGSNHEQLSFGGIDYGNWAWERDHGLRLPHNTYYSVNRLFRTFRDMQVRCGMNSDCPYHAPESPIVTIELGPDDSLVIHGRIKDSDSDNADDMLFDGELSLAPEEIAPGRFTISDRNIDLTGHIDMVSVDHAGPPPDERPDLIISDITQHTDSGQLRIDVYNAAAPLENQSITIRTERMTSGEVLDTITWDSVSIPTGGYQLLGSTLVVDLHDLRLVLDPDNQIVETTDGEGNNVFETPVRMRVEFLELDAAKCNETCMLGNCDADYVFWVRAGYGHSFLAGAEWRGRSRYPASGQVHRCGSAGGCNMDVNHEDWILEGNERYTFEFDVPADQELLIWAEGEEQDSLSMDDSMGDVKVAYGREADWGARPDAYSGQYDHAVDCDEAGCYGCPSGLRARWRISRVH